MKNTIKTMVCMILTIAMLAAGCSAPAQPAASAAPAGAAPAASAPAASSAPAAKAQYMFATGSQGGAYSLVGGGMAKCINEIYSSVEVIATVPTATSQSPSMLDSNQVQMCIGMADMVARARAGVQEYDGKAISSNVMELCAMYDNGMAYVVLANSKIQSIKDVEGKKFSVASEATRKQTAAVVAAAGMDPEKVNWQVIPYQQAAEALMDGTIDVMSLTSMPRNSLVDQIAMKGFRFVEIDEATRAKYDAENPLWKMMEVPANTYPEQTASAWGPAYYTVLYGNNTISEEDAYQMVKAMMEHNDIVEAVYGAGKDLTVETTKRYIDAGVIDPANFHPGAARYFKEAGIL